MKSSIRDPANFNAKQDYFRMNRCGLQYVSITVIVEICRGQTSCGCGAAMWR